RLGATESMKGHSDETARLLKVRTQVVDIIDSVRREMSKDEHLADRLHSALAAAYDWEVKKLKTAAPPPEFTEQELKVAEANVREARNSGLLERLVSYQAVYERNSAHKSKAVGPSRDVTMAFMGLLNLRESERRMKAFDKPGDEPGQDQRILIRGGR